MNEMKTGYEWCLSANMRVLDIMSWPTDNLSAEESYFTENITSEEFLRRVGQCKVKANSTPRKTDMYLEYRMYGLVPYNISPIQQGIQFGHAVVRYGRSVSGLEPMQTIYNKYADNDETFIILNGGTTNNNPKKLGTLNKHFQVFVDNGILVQPFYEPDLGEQLTAFVFLVDERVFDRELYPDFQEEKLPYGVRKPSKKAQIDLEERNESNYQKWVEKIGGPKNAFLREYLKPLRLA
jgi:hypothetical protein